MKLKTSIYIFLLLIFCASLFAYNEEKQLPDLIQMEEAFFLSSEQGMYEQLTFIRNTIDILLDYINISDDTLFNHLISNSKQTINTIQKISEDSYNKIFHVKYSDERPFKINGIDTYIYYNNFFKSQKLSEDERTKLYEKEVNQQKDFKVLSKLLLNKGSLKSLIPGQSYNFIINTENECFISYKQRYKLAKDKGKVIYCPNHTILAGNNPVLAAGEIDYYRVNNRELFIISCTSGHFHPRPSSLIHMKNYLINMGIPEESIVLLALSYKKINSEIIKIKINKEKL